MIVRRGTDSTATFQVDGPAAGSPVVILPGAVEVRNQGATGRYELTIPPSVETVRVEVERRHVAELGGAGRVPLNGAPPEPER